MVASLTHLGSVLIMASLPIVMLALPLGGVSIYEVLAAYLWLVASVILFGSIGLACSGGFRRTASSLVVSYLLILPLVLIGAIFWRGLASMGDLRLYIAALILPPVFLFISALLCRWTAHRLLYPPDVGSEGKDVIDLEQESKEAIGMVIQRDQFPDRLFAPPRRTKLMLDNANPVYDKEIHAELFSQGTLMLRLVIQISMLLAIPLMAFTLFSFNPDQPPERVPWYMSYVLVFNILVAPVFSAGSLTSERERQTFELLLTTVLAPSQIMWGKLLAGFRVSYVLTMFLMWPVVLAFCLAFPFYFPIWASILTFFLIVFVAAAFNSISAMLCSALCKKTSVALLVSYSLLIALYFVPVAAWYLASTVSTDDTLLNALQWLGISSPLMTAFWVPLENDLAKPDVLDGWKLVLSYFAFSSVAIAVMFGVTGFLLKKRVGMTGR